MNNNDFAQFIDELRESRNISREKLVDGIISQRQYYRFLNGDSSLKNDIIDIRQNEGKHCTFYLTFSSNRKDEQGHI